MLRLGVKKKGDPFYQVGNIIKTYKKCKDKIYPQLYGNGKVKAPEQIQVMLFKILPSC